MLIQVKLLVDHNAHDATLLDDPGLQVYYGHVTCVTLPANRKIQLAEDWVPQETLMERQLCCQKHLQALGWMDP
jgi:hypothetical protein